MKNFRLTIKGVIMAVAVTGLAACSDSKYDDDDEGNDYDYTELISTYVDDVVIPTYADMKDKAYVLLQKATAFSGDKTQANLDAVCDAWLAVRAPWELSEAFLFGPCGENGLNVDPNIDTWPFDEAGLSSKLAGSDPIGVAAVSGYPETQRGYHTIEYLIFKDGLHKQVATAQLSARETEYMVSAATVLYYDCVRVWAAWNGWSGLGATDQAAVTAMNAIGYWDVATTYTESYAAKFKNAKSPYTSKADVVDEIIDGCRDIASEVADNKLGAPYEENNIALVESHYAYNSLTDFVGNIYSIRNAYYGSLSGTIAVNSLAAFVKSQDGGEAIHSQIVNAMNNAVAKINAIPTPFATHLTSAGTQIEAAVTACADVETAFLRIKTLM